MHLPDHFLDTQTTVATSAVAAAAVAMAVQRSRGELADLAATVRVAADARSAVGTKVLLTAATTGLVFAVQMLNFPVANGTSGHLLGAVLAAVLVGPWAAVICIAVVLLVQALFADGGLTALGLNVVNMGLVAGLGGYTTFLVARRLLPRTKGRVVLASAVAAGLSVVLASVAFVAEYALGGIVDLSLGGVLGAMVGVHVLIGIGEAVITAMTVSAVLAVRPDLVHGAGDLRPVPEVRPALVR